MIRVTGGRFRGRRLEVPPRVRPTTELARKAVFDILGPAIEGARVLDAAAGSGALGLEALSRGAAQAVFVEEATPAIRVLRANIAALGLSVDEALVVPTSIARYLARGVETPFDVVFHDPPYHPGPDDDLRALLLVVSVEGVLIHERGGEDDPLPSGPRPFRHRSYGDTHLLFYRRAEC